MVGVVPDEVVVRDRGEGPAAEEATGPGPGPGPGHGLLVGAGALSDELLARLLLGDLQGAAGPTVPGEQLLRARLLARQLLARVAAPLGQGAELRLRLLPTGRPDPAAPDRLVVELPAQAGEPLQVGASAAEARAPRSRRRLRGAAAAPLQRHSLRSSVFHWDGTWWGWRGRVWQKGGWENLLIRPVFICTD
jgi:hypothetical protein